MTQPATATDTTLPKASAQARQSNLSKARRPGPESATSRWSFHFAVHAIDANQTQFVLGVDQGGLTSAQARSVVADLGQATEVVAARKEGVDASQCWRRSKEFLGRLALSRPLVRPATVRPAGERDVPAPSRPSNAQRPVTYSLVGPAIERVCRRLEDEFDGPAGRVAPFTASVQAAHRVSDLTWS